MVSLANVVRLTNVVSLATNIIDLTELKYFHKSIWLFYLKV